MLLGLWGDDDQLGMLNLLPNERTRWAAALVRCGAVFPLNLPLHEPQPHLRGGRRPSTTSFTSAMRPAAFSPAAPTTPPPG